MKAKSLLSLLLTAALMLSMMAPVLAASAETELPRASQTRLEETNEVVSIRLQAAGKLVYGSPFELSVVARPADAQYIGVVLGIASARLYYVAMAPYNYDTIWDVLAVRDGGLAIYGGIIGAFVFGGLACKWRGVPVLPCLTWPAWASSSDRAAAAGATSSIRRLSAATPPCPGACSAKQRKIT